MDTNTKVTMFMLQIVFKDTEYIFHVKYTAMYLIAIFVFVVMPNSQMLILVSQTGLQQILKWFTVHFY